MSLRGIAVDWSLFSGMQWKDLSSLVSVLLGFH